MTLLRTRTMLMRLLITRSMPNEIAKHMNNANEAASMRTMVNEVAKHMHNGK